MSSDPFEYYKIKDVISAHMCGPSPTCEERPIASTEEWGLLKTTAVTWGGWNPNAHKVPPKEFWNNSHLEVKEGDVLVTKAGPRQRCGVVVYVDKTPPRLMVSGKMIGLRPDPTKVNYKVLATALCQFEPQRFLDSRTTGMADSQLNFTNELLLNTEVLLPPQPEQTKIAEILSTIDLAIEQTVALIAKQQRIKTGLMQDLLTRGIDEHGNLRSEETHEFKDSPLGRIPFEWEIKSINDLAIHVGSGITPRGGESVYTSDGIMFIRSQNVHFGGLLLDDVAFIPKKIHSSMSRSKVFENDVLLNITGASIGRCCRMPSISVEANVNQHVCAIRLQKQCESDACFLTSVLESSIGQNQVFQFNAGGNREGLNYQQVRSFLIPWPLEDERSRVFTLLKGVSLSLNSMAMNLHKLRSLKTALMQDLLTGKKRVTPLLEPVATN